MFKRLGWLLLLVSVAATNAYADANSPASETLEPTQHEFVVKNF